MAGLAEQSAADVSFRKNEAVLKRTRVLGRETGSSVHPTDLSKVALRVASVAAAGECLPGFPRSVEFTLGNGEVCDALECACCHMTAGEEATIICHVSGMAAWTSLGLSGLTAPILFEITLLSSKKGPRKQTMTEAEKMDFALLQKDIGAHLFKENRAELAMNKYNTIVVFLDYVDRMFTGEAAQQRARELKIVCQLNRAACALKLGDFKRAAAPEEPEDEEVLALGVSAAREAAKAAAEEKAFCTTSTLTLADGIVLAKTHRSGREALELLGFEANSSSSASPSVGEDEESLVAKEEAEELWHLRPPGRSPPEPVPSNCSEELSQQRIDWAVFGEPGASAGGASREAALSDPLATNIAYFRRSVEVALEPWVPAELGGQFTVVARLAKSVHGEVLYVQDREGVGAVAKVVPKETARKTLAGTDSEINERHIWLGSLEIPQLEDLGTEIAVLRYLQRSHEQSSHVVRLLGAFEDACSTYLVTEYCDEGELFERVAYGDPLAETEKKRYVSEMLQAVQHLHRHNVGHRDVSLENVLLRRGRCVLMDFGQAVRLRAVDGTELRYYAEAGKRMYRSPEMYVSRVSPVQVVCPSDGVPGSVVQVAFDRTRCQVLLPKDAVPGKPCFAEPHGYAAAPADLFACGVCAFILTAGKPPWAAALDSDASFSFIRRHGVVTLLQQWRGGARGPPSTPPSEEESLLAQMLRVDPTRRSTVDECLRSSWLDAVTPPRLRSQTA
ncbi:unnamed protein product [Polarella glacialis]|uniref:Protein kinase domain-containing protein n=1 Tax=Polarella glacialis TaxID=89957 RepID=A0A813EII4_POLGL|nr:unnamed protein product [Polarella glacialis]